MGRKKVTAKRCNLDGTPYIPVYEEESDKRKAADIAWLRAQWEVTRREVSPATIRVARWRGGML